MLLLSLFSSTFSVAGKWQLLTGEWPPYTTEKIKGGGLCVEIVRAVLNVKNQPFEIKFLPWSRALMYVSHNEAIGTFAWCYTIDRAKIYNWTLHFVQQKEIFIYCKYYHQYIIWNSFKDLRKYKIGGTQGYSHVETLRRNNLNVDVCCSDIINIRKIYANRIDIFPIDMLTARFLIAKEYSDKKEIFGFSEKVFNDSSLGLMVSKTHPKNHQFITLFNDGLNRIKSNGTLNKIYQSWNERLIL